jgi:hypothetical protein
LNAAASTFSNQKKELKHIAGDAVQNNLVLIIVPLFALLALAIILQEAEQTPWVNVVIPIFAGMLTGNASASVGLMSMSNTMASFAPIYGIGLAIGLLVMFTLRTSGAGAEFGLAAWKLPTIRGSCAICGPVSAKSPAVFDIPLF